MLTITVFALLAAAQPAPEKPQAEAPGARPTPAPSRVIAPSTGPVAAWPTRPLQSLVTMADYPAEALARRQQGRTAFRLTIGPDGRVSGCVILVSSGSGALDNATCQIMVRRGRFMPARDASGRPVADNHYDELNWRIQR